jgi:uncharacterized protein (TIGR04222 family)
MAIDARHQDLWLRILGHRLDDPESQLTFTARLARENGWTIGHACRVVDEYRRFVFLAMTAGHSVTPSEDVDQVWHLHLVYTRDYWDTFCGEVLQAPLHHGPTRGGSGEADRYDTQYRQTLAAYSAVFDESPPVAIWPEPERRFGADLAWRRVNVVRNWVIAKPAWLSRSARWPARRGALAAVPLFLIGIENPLDFTAGPFLTLFALLAAAAIGVGRVLWQWLIPEGDSGTEAAANDPLELALLSQQEGRLRFAAVGLAMLKLPDDQQQEADSTAGDRVVPLPSSMPAESSVWLKSLQRRLPALGQAAPQQAIKAAMELAAEEVEPQLVKRGWLVGRWWSTPRPWICTAPAIAVLLLGIAKINVGLTRGKHVGFLVLGCAALTLVILVAIARKPRCTRQGEAVRENALTRFREWERQAERDDRESSPLLTPFGVALLGVEMLAGTGHAALQAALLATRPKADTGGGCGGGGCGGGGCGGGGCGGCGGCGG